ncbi:hypothetical protein ACFWXK_36420 [Streptomyces sp. NPDC059070]|uniref:hypothetical protein n=1 Tax=Streptomyces sp. NPDC059070 TaxID=3346713 RepID=UPI0036868BDD
MSARGGGGAHWNDETQSWEQGDARQSAPAPGAPPSAPPPPSGPPARPPLAPPPWLGPASPFGADQGAPHDEVPPHEAPTRGAYLLPPDPLAPPPYAPGDPGPDPAARRRQRAVVAAVAVAVLAGGAAGGWALWGRDDGPGRAAGASSSATARESGPTDTASGTPTDSPGDTSGGTPTGEPTSAATPDISTAAVPEGFRQVDDPLGWRVAVPQTWTRTEERSSALYRSPDQRYLLQMFRLTEPGITPYDALRITSGNLASQRGYQEVSLRRLPGTTGTDAAELVYAYDRDAPAERIQGVARSFVAGNGAPYTVLVYGPVTDWPRQQAVLNTVLDTFAPS